jgi:hypothetical protein
MKFFRDIARWFKGLLLQPAAQPAPERPQYERRYPLRRIPLYAGKGQPPAGHWGPCHPSTMSRFKAQFTCTYGHAIVLSDHDVGDDGRVYPSIVCRAPGCAYHEIVILDGWTFGSLGASAYKVA